MSFFIAAYLVLWAGILAYLLRLALGLRTLREEMRALAIHSASAEIRPLSHDEIAEPRHPLEPPVTR